MPFNKRAIRSNHMSAADTQPTFEALLDYLRLHHGFDFTSYKRSYLMRRIQKRMQMLQIESVSDYGDYLRVHPQEFTPLFNTILINFTGFFRDAAAWDYIAVATRNYKHTDPKSSHFQDQIN